MAKKKRGRSPPLPWVKEGSPKIEARGVAMGGTWLPARHSTGWALGAAAEEEGVSGGDRMMGCATAWLLAPLTRGALLEQLGIF